MVYNFFAAWQIRTCDGIERSFFHLRAGTKKNAITINVISTVLCRSLLEIMRRKPPNWEAQLDSKLESDTTLTEVKSNDDGAQVATTRGISMTWKNLRVNANIEKKHIFFRGSRTVREIIHNVNGYVEPNSLVAILGASGSGKSTLMSALAGRQSGDLEIYGDVRVNGKKMKFDVMKSICGFVYQDEIFCHAMTVSEHLHFAGKLKLSRHLTRKQREHLVNELIADVGLTECANHLICSSKYGMAKMNLSGGELKRLSVATELITNPALLFCDEPTTGLDSFAAFNLMKVMSDMASHKAQTIVCSVHQPSANIFDLFDQIILLQNGKIAFNGTSTDAMTFFQSIGYSYTENQNPAEYLVRNLAMLPRQEFQHGDEAYDVYLKFQQSQYAERVEHRINQENCDLNFISLANVECISWFYMLFLLTYRNALDIVRNPRVQLITISNNLLGAVIFGVTMMGSATRTQEGITACKATLYSIITVHSFHASWEILNHFPSRMPGFLREYSIGTNTSLIFYLSQIISLSPGLVLGCVLHVTLAYTFVGLNRDWYTFLVSTAIIILIKFAGVAFGILLSLAINSLSTVNVVISGVILIFNTFTGLWIKIKSIPWAICWLQYVSWITYAMEAMLVLQMKGVDHIRCPKSPDLPCLKNGQEVLESLGFDANNFQRDVIMICCICFILNVLGFATLKVKLYFMTNR